MNLLRLTALLIYTYGVFSFGAMFVLWAREMGKAGWGGARADARACGSRRQVEWAGGALTLVSFLWFLGSLLLVLIELDPRIRPWPVMSLLLVLAYCFPPLIAHTTYVEVRADEASAIPRRWSLAVAALYLACASVTIFCLSSFYGFIPVAQAIAGRIAGVGMGLFFSLAGVFSVLLISRHSGRPKSISERASRRWWLGLFALLFVLGVPIILANLGWLSLSGVVEVGLRSLPLAFLFVGTYFGNRFEFFDVFIKRGLALLVSIVLLTAYFVLVPSRLERFPLDWARPWVYAITLLPIVMALPWMFRRLSHWLDTVWLGRQFSTVEAVKHFLSGVQSATTREDLVREAETRMGEIMYAPVQVVLPDMPERAPLEEISLEIPIGRREPGAGTIRLGRRSSQVPYFSQDVILLESLAEVFAYLLENVRLQERKQQQEQREKELSLHASRSELKALRAQINPHFLFNALNAIAGLIPKDPARADRAVEQLAEVFRYTLRRSESEWASLKEEMEAVKAYLDLEQARFGTRLQYRCAIDPRVQEVRIPALVVQTLVENAVKHGVAAIRGPGRIDVDAVFDSGSVEIRVADNGPGFRSGPETPSEGPGDASGFGLRNIRERLQGHFGERASLEITRQEGRRGAVVRVRIPATPAPLEATREAGSLS
jgi:signal transduction histidine kinase